MFDVNLITDYILNIQLQNHDEIVGYILDEKEFERVKQILLEIDRSFPFCWFTTRNGRDVIISVESIEYVHFLFETGIPSKDNDSKKKNNYEEDYCEEENEILIQFKSKSEPNKFSTAYPIEISEIFHSLDLNPDNPLFYFTDDDGETVVFDSRKILYIEAPSLIIEEGDREFESEFDGDNSQT
jgi:hypothetical protein